MPKKTYRPRAKLQAFYTGGPLQLAPDGTTFACACLQETKVVAVKDGSVTLTLSGDGELVTALCFAPDGRSLYVASRTLLVRKWCLLSSECVKILKGHTAPVSDIAVDPSGSVVALGSADRTLTVWDAKNGFRTHTFKGHRAVLLRVVFHPTEAELLSCSQDSTIKVWDLHRSKLKATLTGHNSAVTSAAYSEDGRFFVSAGRDNTLIVWSAQSYTKCAEFPVFEAVEGQGVPDCSPEPSCPAVRPQSEAEVLYGVGLGGDRGQLRVWRTDNGTDVFYRDSADAIPQAEITSLQSFPNQQELLVVKSDCSVEILKLQDALSEGKVRKASSRFLMGNMDEVIDIMFLDGASKIAVASNSATLHLFDAQNLNCVGLLSGHTDAVLCMAAFVFQSNHILVTGAKDQSIRVWDTATCRCLADGVGHASAVTSLATSRSGKLLLTVSSDKLLKVWKLRMESRESETRVTKLKVTSGIVAHTKDINCVDLSPNDALAATGSMDKSIKVFALPSLTLQVTLLGHKRGIWSLQFSSFEKTLLSSSADTTIKMWSLTEASCLRTFEGHSGSILRALYLSQSHQVMSCGGDGLIKLWNVSTCECVNTFDEHDDRIWSIAFAGEEQSLMASGGSDSAVIVWEDSTEQDKEAEVAKQQEQLTKQQDLSNAMHLRDFRRAAGLAFGLEHPRTLLKLLKQNLSRADHLLMFSAIADLLVEDTALKQCLEYVRDWNTNAKHCEEAQLLLKLILERHSPQRLADVPGVGALIEGIESYTVRHLNRLQKLHQASYVVDYVLDSMTVLTPDERDTPMEMTVVETQP